MCDSIHKSNRKRKYFLASAKRIKRWQEILSPYSLKSFKDTDKLCDVHFNPEDIETNFSTVIKGQLVEIARLRPKLKENANPCRNLSYPKQKEKENVKITDVIKISPVVKKPKKGDVLPNPEPTTADQDASFNASENEEIHNDFLNLYEEIYEVLLPSTLWAVFRCPKKEFISFAYMNPVDFKMSKQIILTKYGKYTMKLYDEEVRVIHLTSEKMTSDFLSKDIEEIDSI